MTRRKLFLICVAIFFPMVLVVKNKVYEPISITTVFERVQKDIDERETWFSTYTTIDPIRHYRLLFKHSQNVISNARELGLLSEKDKDSYDVAFNKKLDLLKIFEKDSKRYTEREKQFFKKNKYSFQSFLESLSESGREKYQKEPDFFIEEFTQILLVYYLTLEIVMSFY